MSTFAETFGRRLVHARLALGLTQQELAGKAGIGQKSLSDWERGAVRITFEDAAALAAALGASLDALAAPEVTP